MRRLKWLIAPLLAFLLGATPPAAPPQEPQGPLAEILGIANELKAAIYYAGLAIYAPSLEDQRLYARRVIEIVRGREDGDSPAPLGLLQRISRMERAIAETSLPKKAPLGFVLRNVETFLGLALEEAVAASRVDSLAGGSLHMRKAYAFLYAALGPEIKTPYLGGIWLLLKIAGPHERRGMGH